MGSKKVIGCLLGILLLAVTFGGGIFASVTSTQRHVPALFGVIAGLCWGWLLVRIPRQLPALSRLHRLLYWEIFLAALMLVSLVLLFLLPATSWNKWWIFLVTLLLVYNLISALFRYIRIRLLISSGL